MSGASYFPQYVGLTIGQILERIFRLIRSISNCCLGSPVFPRWPSSLPMA
jgi:hypothetical protein